jgi:leader peptidase (prepilin peptidase)/N-methyltransferase
MMKHVVKTIDRTKHFAVQSLAWQGMERPYALLAWSMLAGLIWLLMKAISGPGLGWVLMPGQIVLLTILVSVCAIDARFGIIPDGLVLALAASGLIQTGLAFLVGEAGPTGLAWTNAAFASYLDAFAWRAGDAAAVFAAALALRGCYRVLRGREGLGLGDVKLVTAAALWTGLSGLPFVLGGAVVSAMLSLLVLRSEGAELRSGDAIAFGPHLALGIWLTVLAT